MTEPATYTETRWGEYPNFECTACPYATLDKDEIEFHLYRVHGPAQSSPPGAGILFDSRGNLMTASSDDGGLDDGDGS